jgi:hypothetical protein
VYDKLACSNCPDTLRPPRDPTPDYHRVHAAAKEDIVAVNTGRVIGGGLAAGAVMGIVDFGISYFTQARWRVEMNNLNPVIVTNAEMPFAVASWILLDLVMGIVLVATYAAIRPRFGPGPYTAARAALLLWMFTACVWASFAVVGMFSWQFFAIGSAVSLVTLVLGANAGAIVYKESATVLHSAPVQVPESSSRPLIQ